MCLCKCVCSSDIYEIATLERTDLSNKCSCRTANLTVCMCFSVCVLPRFRICQLAINPARQFPIKYPTAVPKGGGKSPAKHAIGILELVPKAHGMKY